MLGATILSFIVPETSQLITKAVALVEPKFAKSLSQVLFDSIGCGAMMYLAVDGYRIKNNLLLLIFPVMIFILCGFEHSIADMLYLGCTGVLYSAVGLKFIALVLLGNAIGALFFSYFHKLVKE